MAGPLGQIVAVGERQEIEEVAGGEQRVDVVLEGDVGDARFGGVGDRAAQFLLGHDLVGDGLHHVGAGDEHVARILHHEDEVGHRRRIDRAARAGAHDQADLRDHAGGEHVALEDLGIAGEAGDAFLDAGAAAESLRPMTGAPTFIAMSITLQIFCAWRSRERAAEDGEILREDEDQAAVDRARAGDDAVAGELLLVHAEVDAIMLDIHVIFFERALIEQHPEPLARGQPPLGMLRRDPLLAAAEARGRAAPVQLFDRGAHSRFLCATGRRGKPRPGPGQAICRSPRAG